MKGVGAAEWLLRRVSAPEHAAAQVGDLLELAQARGSFWFWRAVLGSFVRAGWRFTSALAAAFVCSQAMAALWTLGAFGNTPDLNSVRTSGAVLLAPLCAMPVFLLVRFGLRDAHARFALALAVAAVASLVWFPHPVLRWTFVAVALGCVALWRADARPGWAPLQVLAQMGSAMAISVGMLALYLLSWLGLWAVAVAWLHRPELFQRVTGGLASGPVNTLVDLLTCLLVVCAGERLQLLWASRESAAALR